MDYENDQVIVETVSGDSHRYRPNMANEDPRGQYFWSTDIKPSKQDPEQVAQKFEDWCGETAWSQVMHRLSRLGASVQWYDGYPRSTRSPTIAIYGPEGEQLNEGNRLKDYQAAADQLEQRYQNLLDQSSERSVETPTVEPTL